MCRQQRLYGAPSLPGYLLWLLSSNLELPGVVPRSDPFLSFSSTMLPGVESRPSILVLYQLLWQRCCLSTGELFPSSTQGWGAEVPLSPFHLVITLVPECPECSPLCHSSLLASLWLQLLHCPRNSYLLPPSRVTMSGSPSTFHLPQSILSTTLLCQSATSELPLPLQNMDERDLKPCRDLSVLSRNVEYRLSLNCSYFFLSTTHLDVITSHLSNELRSNLIRLVSEDPSDSTFSPGAPNYVWEDEQEGFITRHLDCLHGTQGMGTSVSPCLSGVQAWWTYLYPLEFLLILSQASREVLHTKLFRVVDHRNMNHGERKGIGWQLPRSNSMGRSVLDSPTRLLLQAEPGEAGEIKDHRVVRKDAVQLGM